MKSIAEAAREYAVHMVGSDSYEQNDLEEAFKKGVENAIDNAEYKIVKLHEESGKILSQFGHINDENSAPEMGDVLSEYLAKIEEIETYEKNVDRLKTLQNELDTKEIEVEIEEK